MSAQPVSTEQELAAGSVITTIDLARDYALGNVRVQALRGVSITIQRGEFVALMGASGSGKSTLMHLLGILDVPTRGQYFLEGRDTGRLSPAERARLRGSRLGFVFQNFFLLSDMNAIENVALPLYYQPNPSNARRQAAAALAQVGLQKRALHRPMELSGGERQRVAIARALVSNPALLFADEPTGNLDSETGRELMTLLMELWRQGLTILLVTHDPVIAGYAGRILYMRDGRVVRDEQRQPAPPGGPYVSP